MHRFCYSCMLDDHRPCSCDELKQWLIKLSACQNRPATGTSSLSVWTRIKRTRSHSARIAEAERLLVQVQGRLGDVQLADVEHEGLPKVRDVDREEWRLQPQ